MPTTGDRRPIASRNLRIWQISARTLAAMHCSPNLISILGMVTAMLGAAALALTPYALPLHARLLYLAAAAGIQLRLLANMLDGMVAIASNKASPLGELFNEIPDRISDTALLAGAGYAAGSLPALGWAAAATALFVTYIRAVGKTMGVPGLFHGPMSKSHRMFTLTCACLFLALAPDAWRPVFTPAWPPSSLGLMAIALAIVILGGLVTATRRLARLVNVLKNHPR